MFYFLAIVLLARSDERFAAEYGAVNSVHYLRWSDVGFYAGDTQL